MPEIRIIPTLRDISPLDWNACYATVIENYEYLLAVEQSGIHGFSYAYITAWENGIMLAAMPAFLTDYALDTTLQGAGKKITTAIGSAFPNLLKMKLACLGSPCTESGMAGFHPHVNTSQKQLLLHAMVTAFEHYASERGCKLTGFKDIPETQESDWAPAIQSLRYASLPGMPTAYLDINFTTTDEYLARLSHGMRKDLRRKLRAADAVEIQVTHSLDAVLPEIMALYTATRSRSDWQFEELTEAYFKGVLAHMPAHAFCTLYYVHGKLLAANLLLHDGHTLIDKFFCMNAESGREYNLYFVSWLYNIRYCLAHGLTRYQSGQEGYDTKLRLGSKLLRNTMYFKHRNMLAQGILKLVSPLLSADETLKEAA